MPCNSIVHATKCFNKQMCTGSKALKKHLHEMKAE